MKRRPREGNEKRRRKMRKLLFIVMGKPEHGRSCPRGGSNVCPVGLVTLQIRTFRCGAGDLILPSRKGSPCVWPRGVGGREAAGPEVATTLKVKLPYVCLPACSCCRCCCCRCYRCCRCLGITVRIPTAAFLPPETRFKVIGVRLGAHLP